ncbi:MAG: SUMF1/EgtB/PvdO family nonheme iron enzyme [Thermoguttaceae bacterium]
MRMYKRFSYHWFSSLALNLFACTAAAVPAWGDDAKMSTQHWPQGEFRAMQKNVAAEHGVNLLTLPGAKLVKTDGVDNAAALTDGEIGELGGNGRVAINGAPSRIVYYLGRPRSISQIRVYSGNIDQRGNQDFEVRFARSNSDAEPKFPAEATFTSGDKMLGGNAGGFCTTFAMPDNKKLLNDEKYDWVEFKIWRSYPQNAGTPAKKGNAANSWASFVELQVLADANDDDLFASEAEKQSFLAARRAQAAREKLLTVVSEDVLQALTNIESLRRTIADLANRYGDKYDAASFTKKLDAAEKRLAAAPADSDEFLAAVQEFASVRREILLANPLLKSFDQIVVRRAKNPGLEQNWISNCARGKGNYGNEIIAVNINDAAGEAKTIAKPPHDSFIGDICMHWEGDRMLVTALSDKKTWQIFEVPTDGSGTLKQVTPEMGGDIDNAEGCYLPDGGTLFISTASMLGVPCIDGSSQVGNIFRVEPDGKSVRQLTFEQDQDWNPVIRDDGRIMYQRWEYTDTSHYFTRLLFTMNPDGTKQLSYYGTNSFWPNSVFYARPIPNAPTKFVGIVTGHHGVAREGELVVFDTAKGFREADGVVQRIPGYEKPVEPVIVDQLVDNSWPKFLFPMPLDENYYLVSCRLKPSDPWAIYLVDTFDNMLKLREEPGFHLLEPTPIMARPEPAVIPSQVNLERETANVFITDIYMGDGLKGVPRGSVKKLRLFAYGFGYRGIGGHDYIGMESCWDTRHLLGEVPVYEDGSAAFTIPANTPLAIQPLDDKGRAMQIMRTWFVGMPGESISCIGCHEEQNTVTPRKKTLAMGKTPVNPKPFYGERRPLSFNTEIQPILDKYCVGCHDGSEENKDTPNFASTQPAEKQFSTAYHSLHKYVRRPGPESDAHMLRPMEYHASTSPLFQMLERGHKNVQLDDESMRKLYCWADLNVPFFGTWLEVAEAMNNKDRNAVAKVADRSLAMRTEYGLIENDFEAGSVYTPPDPAARPKFVEPVKLPKPDRSAPTLTAFPLTASEATTRQQSGDWKQAVKVGDTQFSMVKIPAGECVLGDEDGKRNELPRTVAKFAKPFWMMTTEVTNALYNEFDPQHDSRFIDQWWKDHTTPGYPHNKPQQPVIRVTWREAEAFAKWLSEKTGKKFRLPTEAEWEYACRAGSATPMWFGECDADFGKFENLADDSLIRFVVTGVNPQPVNNPPEWWAFLPRAKGVNDGNMISQEVGAYATNPWGLHDMHGSVAEWTLSDFAPYPYVADDGRNAGSPDTPKVVRGGSWSERPELARSGRRLAYEPWQPVYNVGFRLVMEE